jgi:beta-mannosidase
VPRDAGAGWDFDDVRDHYLRELFGLDPGELRAEDPERYLAVSRVVTGEVMAATLGEWRRQRSPCRGALLWTLNDVLPGAGWGVLDFRGRPKAAYWYVRRALLPLAVWMTDEGTNGVAVHVANDTPRPVNGRLVVALHRRDGQAVAEESLELELPPHDSREHSVEGVLGRFADAGHAYRFGPPEHATVTAALCDDDGLALSAPAVLFPLGLPTQQDPLVDLGLEASASPGDGDSWTVVARSTRAAYSVAVEAPGFDTSDNHFTLSPGRPQSLTLVPVSAEASPSAVRLRPLNATSAAPLRLP